jgi:hypothetical protein
MQTRAIIATATIAGSIALVRSSQAALWEYRFTGVFHSDAQGTGDGLGVGIFEGIDGANPQGASFVFSAVFDDTSFAYTPPLWDGTYFVQERFAFPTLSVTISRNGSILSLNDGGFWVERNSLMSTLQVVGSDGGTNLTSLFQFVNPLPIHPSPLAFTPFSGGSGEGIHTQTGAASLRYRFNDASLTLVPAPSAAPLLALAGLTARGRRRR